MADDGLTTKRELIAQWRAEAEADEAMAKTVHERSRHFYETKAANLRVQADRLEATLPAQVSPPFEGEIPDSSEPQA